MVIAELKGAKQVIAACFGYHCARGPSLKELVVVVTSNAAQDVCDAVSVHSCVVTSADGSTQLGLNQVQLFCCEDAGVGEYQPVDDSVQYKLRHVYSS